jgi:hypothetical protein
LQPKYSTLEIERRWLVQAVDALPLSAARVRKLDDKYLSGGRLRLRKVSEVSCAPIYKLGKKYLGAAPEPEAVVSVYLTEVEYKSLLVLPGRSATKLRYSVEGGAVDVYESPSQEAATAYAAPRFVHSEVTFNERYTGFALCGEAL